MCDCNVDSLMQAVADWPRWSACPMAREPLMEWTPTILNKNAIKEQTQTTLLVVEVTQVQCERTFSRAKDHKAKFKKFSA